MYHSPPFDRRIYSIKGIIIISFNSVIVYSVIPSICKSMFFIPRRYARNVVRDNKTLTPGYISVPPNVVQNIYVLSIKHLTKNDISYLLICSCD